MAARVAARVSKAEAADEGQSLTDKRMQWMEARIAVALRLKHTELRKFIDSDEVRMAFSDFLDVPDSRHLFITANPPACHTEPPDLLKRKALFFLKRTREKITPENIAKSVVCGDIGSNVLECLALLASDVYAPHLPLSLTPLAPSVGRDVLDSLNKFIAQLHVTIGITAGRTVLPLPPIDSASLAAPPAPPAAITAEPGASSAVVVHAGSPGTADEVAARNEAVRVVEGAVLGWSRQVKEVLRQEVDASLPPRASPLEELDFWETRARDLAGLADQLASPAALHLLRFLAAVGSSYGASFSRVAREAEAAAAEAAEVVRVLAPLRPLCEVTAPSPGGGERVDFASLGVSGHFRKVFHMVYLVWCHSQHFATPSRLVSFIRKLTNDVVACAHAASRVSDLLTCEPEDAIRRLGGVLATCGAFKAAYFHYKARVAREGLQPWRFPNTALFGYLDAFLERCHDVLDIIETGTVFAKLEKTEIGGTLGRQLTATAHSILDAFNAAIGKFKAADYDLLSVEAAQFAVDFAAFRATVRDLELQVGAVLTRALDACPHIAAAFKVVDSFGELLDRDAIHQLWLSRQHNIISLYAAELAAVRTTFLSLMHSPPQLDHVPPTASALFWVRGLVERIDAPMERFRDLDTAVLSSPPARDAQRLYGALTRELRAFAASRFDAWAAKVGAVAREKLHRNLLRRDGAAPGVPGRLEVNFDPELTRLLREVRYLLVLNSFDGVEKWSVPQPALEVSEQADLFRRQTLALGQVAELYNEIQASMLPVERPLFSRDLHALDVALAEGVSDLTWTRGPRVDAFLASVSGLATGLDRVLGVLHRNAAEIEALFVKFRDGDNLLPLRPRLHKTSPLDVFVRRYAERQAERATELAAVSSGLSGKVASSLSSLPSVLQTSEEWRVYVRHLDSLAAKGAVEIALHAVRQLRDQVSGDWLRANDGIPLLDIRLTLGPRPVAPASAAPPPPPAAGSAGAQQGAGLEALFVPPLEAKDDFDAGGSLEHHVNTWLADAVRLAGAVAALEGGEGATYQPVVAANPAVEALVAEARALVRDSFAKCREFLGLFSGLDYLWARDPAKAFEDFIRPRRAAARRAAEEDEDADPPAAGAGGGEKAGEKSAAAEDERADTFVGVKLQYFEERILYYEGVASQIADLPDSTVAGWVRCDAKPLKSALKAACARWKSTFVTYLVERLERAYVDVARFIDDVSKGLALELDDGNMDALRLVLGQIRDCKARNAGIVAMFEPMNAVMALVRRHAAGTVDEATFTRLDDLRRSVPERWDTTYKRSLQVRELLADKQDAEARKLRSATQQFEREVGAFREKFGRIPPFTYAISEDAAYAELDRWHTELLAMEEAAANVRNLQELFELNASEFRALRECRSELRLLKQVWDMIMHVKALFREWLETPFHAVEVGLLLEEVRKLQRQLKAFHARAKSWACLVGIDADVRNMATALPLVQDLRSPAMRDRHWRYLLKRCGVDQAVNPNAETFSLGKLVGLGLHSHVEEVGTVVERAAKELLIEKSLRKIEETWGKLELPYVHNAELGVYLLGPTDDVVEVLEDNNALLQTMQSNRFVEFFGDEVGRWQQWLGLVDTVLGKWTDVQKKWVNLFPIFVKSDDIRRQLPVDAQAFAGTDAAFRALMEKARVVTNAVQACTSHTIVLALGRSAQTATMETLLDEMDAVLSQCEKALADYLETKRTAFPRFYFVSSGDLVDILSKGSSPQSVMVHISKIIDAVDRFEFSPGTGPGGEPSKEVVRMISREGEVVDLIRPVTCTGPVEVWLQALIEAMQATVNAVLAEAHAAYVEHPRTQWLFAYCAQVVVAASRIWWASEVAAAFDRLEDGNEAAMRDYLKQQKQQLAASIGLVMGSLSKEDRRKLITLITTDVHARDVVQKLLDDKVEEASAFQWQAQLRFSWDDATGCVADICDARFIHGREYIGNCGCLVITPLTDRCYITLSQSLRLCMGGAPAGPAGTGKTETTKDLARAMGFPCYVFNCSDQMDYRSLGNLFKGLAMSGAWGCFDEFNRIAIEVLSVVAVQVKTILDAVRAKRARFMFMGTDEISLTPSVGVFITMNPGYKGRTELPENIKALFRPCAMIVPDIQAICEIMLAAEGFVEAKDLAKKFVSLYSLNKELLSRQAHYDWGLRAVKSVLVIAGGLKRADPDVDERKVLLRALRDTNRAKLARTDVDVFAKLLSALFPGLEIAPKVDPGLEANVRRAVAERRLQVGDADVFVLKCVQFKELLDVRHSVFILGPPGCGKSETWRTLSSALLLQGDKVVTEVLNPKAISSNELYGYVHETTREWRDGLLARMFRDLAAMSRTKKNSKWIVLDGDIDTEWIESMNTVMDDNKMLTLASNERIPLTDSMRLVFEVSHLRNASPATVSRAGILYINDTDVGWTPLRDSWLAASKLEDKARAALELLYEKFVPTCLEFVRRAVRSVVPMPEIAIVSTLNAMLDCLFTAENCPPGTSSDVYERLFVFAVLWACGAAASVSDSPTDYRTVFSTWFRREFAAVRLPDQGTAFDYFVDPKTKEYTPWTAIVPKYVHDSDLVRAQGVAAVQVPTVDTVRVSYWLGLLSGMGAPVMLVGRAGTGKSAIVASHIAKLDPSEFISRRVLFNAATGSASLQAVMEQSLDKKAGRQYGPPGRKRCLFFLDDLNMPEPDKYGTQSAMSLLRQHLDYGFMYDRAKLTLKEVVKVQYVAAMNHKAGTFSVDGRLQRHFATFAVSMPDRVDLKTILTSIVCGHFAAAGVSRDVLAVLDRAVTASIDLHRDVTKAFVPTAVNFQYVFNLRDLAAIAQGLVCHDAARLDPALVVSLWAHEASRTFSDRMVCESDIKRFGELVAERVRASFSDIGQLDSLVPEPLLFVPQSSPSSDECVYTHVETYDDLHRFLSAKLGEYNSERAQMDLVLFSQAMEHVTRIARILYRPRGSALLVGVGGSGKQSLAKLAAYIVGLDIAQIAVSSTYTHSDFKQDLQALYLKAGQKGYPLALILTDTQIVDRRFLVALNDLLATGHVPELFAADEKESVETSLVSEVKASGHPDYGSREVCWEWFISKVRANLHVVMCCSPVGETFRTWCRSFPSLYTCTTMDWFHSWPHQALVSVAAKFLEDVPFEGEDMCGSIAEHMAHVQSTVVDASAALLAAERRHNYATPKSFLELIALYKSSLCAKRTEADDMRKRLQSGILKIKAAGDAVKDLKGALEHEREEVGEKAVANKELLDYVAKEKALVAEQRAIAAEEERKANEVSREVNEYARLCEEDLTRARPIVEAAIAALNTLNRANLTELKSMPNPPPDVAMVTGAVVALTQTVGTRVPKDRSWAASKKMMSNVTTWLKELEGFDRDNIPQAAYDAIVDQVKSDRFDAREIEAKSFAAAGLAKWVIGMVKYHEIRCDVRPKEEKLREARERLARAEMDRRRAQDRVSDLQSKLDKVLSSFNAADSERLQIEGQAASTQLRLDLAERLVNGLAEENVRWQAAILKSAATTRVLVGDTLLASAFVSFAGPFPRPQRIDLLKSQWTPDLEARGVPFTRGADPVLDVLASEASVAQWINEGLPPDRMSCENGAITVSASRWPLLIDPQLQGVRWIRQREEKRGLKVFQQGSPGYLRALVDCVEAGTPVLVDNVGEALDPMLEPILSRQFMLRGGSKYLRIGDAEVRVDPRFRLYLATRLGNPHFRPEVHAQCTLVNFLVTEDGLTDQLLSTVVRLERPELEDERIALIHSVNEMKIELRRCEDALLFELTNAQGDILQNRALIESLEGSKRKAVSISASMRDAKVTNERIDVARAAFTPAAERAALLFFSIDSLSRINHMYQYSLEAFVTVFNRALRRAPRAAPGDVAGRVQNIVATVTDALFSATARGLFVKHKLIFAAMVAVAVLSRAGVLDQSHVSFLYRAPRKVGIERPESVAEWLPPAGWAAACALAEVDGATPSFDLLPADLADGKRWREWCELERPEEEKMPLEWKALSSFQRLLVLRCLRPDRMTAALEAFVGESLGRRFVEDVRSDIATTLADSSPTTPLFYILSPGTDPVSTIEALGRKMGFSAEAGTLFNVSLGQGQEAVAEKALDHCFVHGGWVVLSNIHLVSRWLRQLEKKLDGFADTYARQIAAAQRVAELRAKRRRSLRKQSAAKMADLAVPAPSDVGAVAGVTPLGVAEAAADEPAADEIVPTAEELLLDDTVFSDPDLDASLLPTGPRGHPKFRVFLTAEPSDAIPVAVLQRSIKVTNEPPRGLKANMLRAMYCFDDETWEGSSKQSEMKSVVFALCFFHAVLLERKKFGPQGWNRNYPFSLGDLTTCAQVLANYLEDRPKIPWEDLRYMFGEIVYGGHITDDWDRTLCTTYLHQYVRPEVLEGMELAPGFPLPHPTNHAGYVQYIESSTPAESPLLYGLHPNSEIKFRTEQGELLFRTLLELAPRSSATGGEAADQDKLRNLVDELLAGLPEDHNIAEVTERLDDDRSPFQNVFLQECDRMNSLLREMRRSLSELDLALKGALSMTTQLAEIGDELVLERVPEQWAAVNFLSSRPLGSWFSNLQDRNQQLSEWTADLQVPKCVWISGLFNPTAFLTAVLQSIALANSFDLDHMVLTTEVLKKQPEHIEAAAREGAFVHGLYLEGARWDASNSTVEDARMKELHFPMPVMLVRGLPASKVEFKDTFACPVYKTPERGAGYVCTAHLRTKASARKWIIGGVALLMDVGGKF